MKWPIGAIAIALCLALAFSAVGCSTKDTIPPSTPAGMSTTSPCNDKTPTFTWNAATDAGSGVDYYLLIIDGGEVGKRWTIVGGVATYTLLGAFSLSDGNHTFEVNAVDKAGNEGVTASLDFTCDTTPQLSLR